MKENSNAVSTSHPPQPPEFCYDKLWTALNRREWLKDTIKTVPKKLLYSLAPSDAFLVFTSRNHGKVSRKRKMRDNSVIVVSHDGLDNQVHVCHEGKLHADPRVINQAPLVVDNEFVRSVYRMWNLSGQSVVQRS